MEGLFLYRLDDSIDEKYRLTLSTDGAADEQKNDVSANDDIIPEIKKYMDDRLNKITQKISDLSHAVKKLSTAQNNFEERIDNIESIANCTVDEMVSVIIQIQNDNEKSPEELKDILINEIGAKSIEITLHHVCKIIKQKNPDSKYLPVIEQVIALIESDEQK